MSPASTRSWIGATSYPAAAKLVAYSGDELPAVANIITWPLICSSPEASRLTIAGKPHAMSKSSRLRPARSAPARRFGITESRTYSAE